MLRITNQTELCSPIYGVEKISILNSHGFCEMLILGILDMMISSRIFDLIIAYLFKTCVFRQDIKH
jgi:hypothetical protein